MSAAPAATDQSLRRLKAAACFWQAVGWGLFSLACHVLRESLLTHQLRPGG